MENDAYTVALVLYSKRLDSKVVFFPIHHKVLHILLLFVTLQPYISSVTIENSVWS